ncbi:MULTISPECIES: hypothetical protein [unclassified Paenibacillus]|nr:MULTISPECIES: hypothetical protein [unclassified Paenibacillus]MDQ0896272.1 hypothetical protein [Paenibacillus sp. V4I7]MDQ0913800.1 hypothetical protein [Paenibacillus sp. V4I5]
MEYRVKHKETGETLVLNHNEVNDMVYGDNGQIIVFDTKMEVYLLIDEEE